MAKSTNTRKAQLLVILAVAAIIVVAGLIVLLVRALGGDRPAPSGAITSLSTQSKKPETQSMPPGVTTDRTAQSQPVRQPRQPVTTPAAAADTTGIHQEDWAALLGVARQATDPGASTRGYLDSVIYTDLTCDGRDDALVLVRMPGSGAYLTYYIYSDEGSGPTQLFKKADISHGQVQMGSLPCSFEDTEPVYGPGEPECCPSQLKKTTYTWAASAKVFVETTVKTVPAS